MNIFKSSVKSNKSGINHKEPEMKQVPEKKKSPISEELQDLIDKINEGSKKIGDKKEKKGILILGETGVGKSTLTYLFAGKTLKVAKLMNNANLILDLDNPDLDSINNIEISHLKVSRTLIPSNIKTDDGFVIWDCPGFGDIGRNPSQDIANSFYIQRLFSTSSELKFVIIVPAHYTNQRGQDVVRVFEHFSAFFDSVSELKLSVFLLVNHVDKDKSKQNIISSFQEIMNDNKFLSPKAKELMTYCLNSLEIFFSPTQVGVLDRKHYSDFIESIKKNVRFFETKGCKTNIEISEKSVPLAEKFFKVTADELRDSLDQISEIFQRNCLENSKLSDNIEEFFFQSELNLKLTENQVHLRELLRIETLIKLGNIFASLVEKMNDLESEVCFDRLNEKIPIILFIITQFTDKGGNKQNPINLDKDRNVFVQEIIEKSNKIKFLIKVLKGRQSIINFVKDTIGRFVSMKEKINVVLKENILNFKIYPNEISSLYYEQILEFLENYKDDSKVSINLSSCCLYLAKIYIKKNKIQDSVYFCINSCLHWDYNPEALDLLNSIFYEHFDQIMVLKTHDQTEIHQSLFIINNKKMLVLLDESRKTISKYLDDHGKYETFEFIDKIYEILKKLSNFTQTPIKVNITKAIKLISECLDIIPAEADLKENLLKRAEYLKLLYELNSELAPKEWEKDWFNYFNKFPNEIKFLMFKKIKEITIDKTFSAQQLKNIIAYTSLQLKVNLKEGQFSTNEDPDFIMLQRNALYVLGKMQLSTQSFAEAESNFLKAIELYPDGNEANFKALEFLYFNNHQLKINKEEIFEKMYEVAADEFKIMFEKRVKFLLNDFLSTRKFFPRSEKEKENMEYLEDILAISKLILSYDSINDYENVDKKYFHILQEIEEKVEIYANAKEIQEGDPQTQTVCEYIFKSDDLFGISCLTKQISYCKWLSVKLRKEKERLRFLAILDLSIQSCNYQWIVNQLQNKLISYEISIEENEPEYYIKLLELFQNVLNDNRGLHKIHLCYKKLGDIYSCNQNNEEAIKNYEASLEVLDDLYVMCVKEDKLEFYAKESFKKEIVRKLGDLLFSLEDYEGAYNVYKKTNEYTKIKKCFKKMKKLKKGDINFLEEKGDYFFNIGLIESSIKIYHKARVLAQDPLVISKFYKKISHALECYEEKAKEFRNIAIDIEKYGIIE